MFLLCNCFFRVIFIVVGVHVRFGLVLVGFYSLDRSCEDDRILYYVTIHSPKRSKQNYAHRTPCSVLIKGCCVWLRSARLYHKEGTYLPTIDTYIGMMRNNL